MSKQCNICNRPFDEYYKLRNGTIMCYNCWSRDKENAQRRQADYHRQSQEDQRRYRDMERNLDNMKAEIVNYEYTSEYREYMNNLGYFHYGSPEEPPGYAYHKTLIHQKINLEREISQFFRGKNYPDFSYLDNPTFYTREMAKKQEKQEEREREIQQKKTISDAQALFETVKQQKFTSEILEDVKRKIASINILVKTNSFFNSLEAIKLMKEEYEWQYKNDKYMSALYNITETRHEFIRKREEAKKKAQELFGKLIQNKPVNNEEELKNIIGEIEKFLCNDTYNDYVTAISLLENKYEWQFNEKEHFYSSLFDIDTEREIFETKRNNAIKEARIKEERQKEAARIEEERVREILRIRKEKKITAYVVFYIGFVLIIIGIKTLFNTGHWFYGILVIVGFLFYAILGNNYLYWWNPSAQKTTWKNMTPNTKLKLIVLGIFLAVIFLIYMCSVV